MKFTTARRIVKEAKKGSPHPPELVAKAHEVCREWHAKVEGGRKVEAELVAQMKAQGIVLHGVTHEEQATRMRKSAQRDIARSRPNVVNSNARVNIVDDM